MLNNLTKFELMMQQRDQQDIITLEKESELANIHVIQMNYKDIPKTEYGKKEAGSIARQLNAWIKTLSDKEKDSNLFFGGLDESVEKFESYMIEKYKGKQKNEWINKFRSPDFVDAVRDILKAKIYEHKAERELFMSGHANHHYQLYQIFKNSRKVSHEAAGRLNKVLKSKGDYTFTEKEIQSLITRTIEQTINEKLTGTLPEVVTQKKLTS